jgi:glycosyltransferase involved in cell wall biosynthesis
MVAALHFQRRRLRCGLNFSLAFVYTAAVRRILLLITDLEIGGTPTVVRELAVRLHRPPEVRVDVACLAGRGPVADQIQAHGIVVKTLDARGTRDLGVFKRFIKLLQSESYDTVFSFLIHANVVAAVGALRTRQVRFVQSIQTTQPTPRWHWFLQRVVHHAAEVVVVPSQSVARVAQIRSHVPARKLAIIPNAIEPADFAGLSLRDTSIPARPVRIGFIGRLDKIKRIPDLIRAVALLKDTVHLHLFGTGSEHQRLDAMVRRKKMEERVTFHGAIARPQEALANIDVLVLPSEAEGFGLVLIEAMAAGVPVVATQVPGICDVVRHKTNGLLAPVRSPRRLAEMIALVTDNSVLRRKLVLIGRNEVRRKYTWEKVLPLYKHLLHLDPPEPAEAESPRPDGTTSPLPPRPAPVQTDAPKPGMAAEREASS